MATVQRTGPRPGWYPDPHDPARLRWWTGAGWTDYTALAPGAPGTSTTRRRQRRSPVVGVTVALLAVAAIVGALSLSSQYVAGSNGISEAADTGSDGGPSVEPPESAPTTAATLTEAIDGTVVVQSECGPGCLMVGGGSAVGPGQVLTADHVLDDSGRAVIVDPDGETHAAIVVDRDPVRDLALLQAPSLSLPFIELRDEPAAIGEPVHAVGAPAGERRVSEGTVTDVLDLESDGVTEVQTDADIDQGNSGGPLLDDRGRLVGVVVSEHEFDDSIGWATSAGDAADFLASADTVPGGGGLEYFSGGQGAQEEIRELIESFLDGWAG